MSVPDSLLKALISEFQCASSTSTGGPCALFTASTLVFCIDDNLLSGPDLWERGHLALLFKVSVDIDAGCLFACFPRLVVHKRMAFESKLH